MFSYDLIFILHTHTYIHRFPSTMSADMFAPQKSTPPAVTTKIPVPSPIPLRRSASLRIRGEAAPSRATNPLQRHHNHPILGGGGGGGAFMEAARSSRPNKTAEHANRGTSPKVPQSPSRNRSLVSDGEEGVRVLIGKWSVEGGIRLCEY